MTPNQVLSLKKRVAHHFDRLARVVRRFKGLPAMRKRRIERELMKDLKREEVVLARVKKRYVRLAHAA